MERKCYGRHDPDHICEGEVEGVVVEGFAPSAVQFDYCAAAVLDCRSRGLVVYPTAELQRD